jgi:hypothetical protein
MISVCEYILVITAFEALTATVGFIQFDDSTLLPAWVSAEEAMAASRRAAEEHRARLERESMRQRVLAETEGRIKEQRENEDVFKRQVFHPLASNDVSRSQTDVYRWHRAPRSSARTRFRTSTPSSLTWAQGWRRFWPSRGASPSPWAASRR